MRTRRSPRNQDILFRELFKPAPAVVEVTLAELERRLTLANRHTRRLALRDIVRFKFNAARRGPGA